MFGKSADADSGLAAGATLLEPAERRAMIAEAESDIEHLLPLPQAPVVTGG